MSHHSNFQRATLLLLLALSIICSATPTTSPSTRKRQAPPTPSPACGFAGNPDIYGIGIRLGLYAQWLSTYLSNWLHSAKVTDMRAINTFFQLAMFTALMAMANQTPSPQVIDPYIVIIQIMGSVSCCLSREKEDVRKGRLLTQKYIGIHDFEGGNTQVAVGENILGRHHPILPVLCRVAVRCMVLVQRARHTRDRRSGVCANRVRV